MAGDCKNRWGAFTYYIYTEKPAGTGRNILLIRSIIKTRRKNIGKDNEYIEENPDLADFVFQSSTGKTLTDQGEELDGPSTITFDNDTIHVI